MSVPTALRRVVWKRAESRCEYCRMPQDLDPATFEVDHVIPEKMDGETTEANLCLPASNAITTKGRTLPGSIQTPAKRRSCSTRETMAGESISYGTARFFAERLLREEPQSHSCRLTQATELLIVGN